MCVHYKLLRTRRPAIQNVKAHSRASDCASLLVIILLSACAPIKQIELRPQLVRTGIGGFGVSEGVCLSVGSAPPLAFLPRFGEAMVGFDDYYDPGTNPFPCSTSRMAIYRSVVIFDLSQFDHIAAGSLTFFLSSSASRANGEFTRSIPGLNSVATAWGPGTQAPSNDLPYDYFGDLGPGTNQKIPLDTALSEWSSHTRANFGIVLDAPRTVTPGDHPKDNDLQISWYDNFRLLITYNPKLNPRAPQ
jgi:hypothetical protein